MTPKKEAKHLVDKFIEINQKHSSDTGEEYGNSYLYHKKCALLVVEGQIEQLNSMVASSWNLTNEAWYLLNHFSDNLL